jgi:lysozyme family protein
MSAANFGSSLTLVLQHEGGFVNDPQDPGGATNKGVTQKVYDDWRRSQGLEPRSVRSLEQVEVEAIYRKLYWDACWCSQLPPGVDYCTFDLAVNSGPARAVRFLQKAVGAVVDGQIGPKTASAANASDDATTINAMCDARQAFLEQLPTFARFGRGWTERVSEVRIRALEMVAEVPPGDSI